MRNLAWSVRTNHGKKNGAVCRFNALRAPSDKTTIVHSEEKIDEIIANQSKKLNEKVLSYIITISDLSDVKYLEILVDHGLFVFTKFPS